ncbi:hypothetical protein I4U23_020352 [Adineta vaga]|nr:hypothetical protein I4U23_020352 [Adineta vaga]
MDLSSNLLADTEIFQPWQYIFNELIQRNRQLNERITQLEQQANQLTEVHVHIKDLQTTNQQLKIEINDHIRRSSEDRYKQDNQIYMKQLEEAMISLNNCILQLNIRVNTNEVQIEKLTNENKQLKEQVNVLQKYPQEMSEQSNNFHLNSNESFTESYEQRKTVLGYAIDKIKHILAEKTGGSAVKSCINNEIDQIQETKQNINEKSGKLKCKNNIQQDNRLLTLDLSGRELADEDIRDVVQALHIDNRYTGLALHHNKITCIGAAMLAEALTSNNILTQLSLSVNHIDDDGVYALVKTLSIKNQTLTGLYLGYNRITDNGAKSLAQMLQINTSLTYLHLSGNNISNEGVRVLSYAIEHHNSTIESLSLDSNKYHGSLKKLHLVNCSLSQKGKERLLKAQQCKENFQIFVGACRQQR